MTVPGTFPAFHPHDEDTATMPKAWLRIDHDMVRHSKMVALPDDTHRLGWFALLGAAKVSDTPGGFASVAHAQEHAGRFAPCVEAYLRVGLLDLADDGRVNVHGWAEYQPDTSTPRVRAHRERLRERSESGSGNVPSSFPSRALSPSPYDVTLGDDEANVAREDDPLGPFYEVAAEVERITGQSYALPTPLSGYGKMAAEHIARHGAPAVLAALRDVAVAYPMAPTVQQLVFGLRDVLDPVRRITPPPPTTPEPEAPRPKPAPMTEDELRAFGLLPVAEA